MKLTPVNGKKPARNLASCHTAGTCEDSQIRFVSERIRRHTSESVRDVLRSMCCLLALVNGVSREPDAKPLHP
jgi:hypothetical protein